MFGPLLDVMFVSLWASISKTFRHYLNTSCPLGIRRFKFVFVLVRIKRNANVFQNNVITY